MQRNVVGLGVEPIERDEFDAELLGARGRQIGIAADQVHAEGAGSVRALGADSAQADDAQRLAGELGALQALLVPLAAARGLVGARDVAGHGEHQAKGEFGDGYRAGAGSVHHHDATPCGDLDVNIVYADARAANDAHTSGGLDEGGVGLHGRAHDERIRIANRKLGIKGKLLGRHHRAVGNLLQHLHGGRRNFFRDDDLHRRSPTAVWAIDWRASA